MTINPARTILARGFYPRSILGEMFLGVLLSMFIGIFFSILAAAFILMIASGGKLDLDPVVTNPSFTNRIVPAPEHKFMLSRR